MAKKYEKFEEWMVGKKVQVEDCSGEVLGRYFPISYIPESDCIQFKTGDDPEAWMWDELPNVEFLEEASPEEEKTEGKVIPWEVGQVVYCLIRGKGQVNSVGRDSVVVWFDKVGAWKYTDKGELLGYEGVRTLFFSEPTILADTMPPKKPFVPKLKEGDKVLIKDKQGLFGEGTVRVVHKECDDRIYVSEDGDYFLKFDIASVQILGAEVKFEEN